MLKLDPHQKEAIRCIEEEYKIADKCLVKMFCGTGKTRIILDLALKNNITVIIFPSISLVTQFNKDYLLNKDWASLLKDYKYMSICSKDEIKEVQVIQYTTQLTEITKFLKQKTKKIIACTYQSLDVFRNSVLNTKITLDLLVYDEAHRLIGNLIQSVAFSKTDLTKRLMATKILFLTATPRNGNGVRMIASNGDIDEEEVDEEDDVKVEDVLVEEEEELDKEELDCGKLVFTYSHKQAVEANICKDFEICVMLYTNKKDDNIYKAIANAAMISNNKNILTFHTTVNDTDRTNNTSVMSFVNGNLTKYSDDIKNKDKPANIKIDIIKTIRDVVDKYPNNKVNNINITSITSFTKDRKSILQKFSESSTDDLNIIASCKTIGEGIDLQNANAICYIDPRTSHVDIVQYAGRCCRHTLRTKNSKPATIIVPCFIDISKYNECMTDAERDALIKESMSARGDFRNIFNVLSALKHNDSNYEAYYKAISENKNIKNNNVKNNNVKNNFKIKVYPSSELEVMWKLKDFDLTQNLMTAYLETTKITNTNDAKCTLIEEFVALNNRFPKCASINIQEKALARWLFRLRKHKEKNTLSKSIVDRISKLPNWHWSVYDIFEINFNKLIKYITDIKELPSESNLDKSIKSLARWSYSIRRMKRENTLDIKYIDQLNLLPVWFWDKEDVFETTFLKFDKWVTDNDSLPNVHSSDKEEKNLGSWIQTQKTHIKNNNLTQDKIDKLNNIVNKYYTKVELYDLKLKEVIEYATKNNRIPNRTSKDPEEMRMGLWCDIQRGNYMRKNMSKETFEKIIKVPFWFWTRQEKHIMINVVRYRTFVEQFQKIPVFIASKNTEENFLTLWERKQKVKKVANTLTLFELTKLNELEQFKLKMKPVIENKIILDKAIIDKANLKNNLKVNSTSVNLKEKPTPVIQVKPTLLPTPVIQVKPKLPMQIKQITPPTTIKTQLRPVRTYQQLLKQNALVLYENKCVITDKMYNLEAAHIKPDSICSNKEKCDLNNILLLNGDAHDFFDKFIITINPTTSRLLVKETCLDLTLVAINNKFIKLHKETLEYLKWHYKEFIQK